MSKEADKQTLGQGKLREMIRKAEIVPKDDLASLEERAQTDDDLARLLLREGYLTAEQLGQLQSQVRGWKFIDLRREPVKPETLTLLPRAVAEAEHAVVFRSEGKGVCVALADPTERPFTRLLRKRFGSHVEFFVAVEAAILTALASAEGGMEERFGQILQRAGREKSPKDEEDRSIVELVEILLLAAVRRGASDIHIEPQEESTIVRLRIDGLLHRTLTFPSAVHTRVILRIKVLSNLATDEHAVPQDGKLLWRTPDGSRVDVRVSIVPTIYGENVVLRLLVSEEQALPLESLGLLPLDRRILEEESKRTWGMILVTGPTGSGKTTTLYAVMRRLNREHVNISTIEDPVEYRLPGASQIQVHEKVGLVFATGLRSLVRQDPNIILVGEIRDRETAGIAVNAAMTGHLVLSTLHTNDAPTAMPRLVDMGVEPFLIASTVNVVIAQRLVRTICVRCRESIDVRREEFQGVIPTEELEKIFGDDAVVRLYRGKGCDLCGGSGFRGRTAIFEVLQMDEEIRRHVVARESADALRIAARAKGMTTMVDDGIAKVRQGLTTIEEVIRVIRSSAS